MNISSGTPKVNFVQWFSTNEAQLGSSQRAQHRTEPSLLNAMSLPSPRSYLPRERRKGITHKTWLGWVLATSPICAPKVYSKIQQTKPQADRLGTRRCDGDNKAQLLPRHLRATRRACTSRFSTGQLCEWTERLGWAGGSRAERGFRQAAIFSIISTRTMRPRSIGGQ